MGKQKYTDDDLLRERWFRGKLGYKLHSGQLLVKEAIRKIPGQLFVGEIARQFGKTFLATTLMIEQAHSAPKQKIKVGTAFQNDLEEILIPSFDAVCEDAPEDLTPQFKTKGSKYVCYNESEIKLIGLDRKPNGLRGQVPDLIVLDEAAFMSRLDYIYRSVIIPATTHRRSCKILVFSTPPESPAHEFVEYVQRAKLIDSHYLATIYDNPMIGERDIQRLMEESGGAESSVWKREYLCEHVVDERLAIIAEWKKEYIQEVSKQDWFPFLHRYVCMDLGVIRHFTAILFGYWDFPNARLVIEDEILVNGPLLTTTVMSDLIKRKEQELWGEMKVYMRYSDNNNPLLVQDLATIHKISFNMTDKGTLEEMVNAVKIMVSRGQIIVHPRCKSLIGCLAYGIWDKKRNTFAESKVFGHFDALAALVYMVRNLNKSTNPIPYDFHVDRGEKILFPVIQDNPNVKALKLGLGLKK